MPNVGPYAYLLSRMLERVHYIVGVRVAARTAGIACRCSSVFLKQFCGTSVQRNLSKLVVASK